MKTLIITEDGSQTIYCGPLSAYRAPNVFLENLVGAALDEGGEATRTDDEGCEVTAYIEPANE